MYPILRQPIQYNNPQIVINPDLIVIHDTDNPNVTAQQHFNYWNGASVGTSTNYVVDWSDIICLIPPGHESWNCGSIGNKRSIGIEMCVTDDPNKFNEMIKRVHFLVQYLLGQFPQCQVVSHKWITQNLGDTTHLDPDTYIQSHGYTWESFHTFLLDKGEKHLGIETDKAHIVVNGSMLNGFIVNGVTFASVREIVEALGKKVSYDDSTKTIEVV